MNNSPLLTASAPPSVSSLEAWLTPALHDNSGATGYACTGGHRPTLNECDGNGPVTGGKALVRTLEAVPGRPEVRNSPRSGNCR
jgi:hypothetical protein